MCSVSVPDDLLLPAPQQAATAAANCGSVPADGACSRCALEVLGKGLRCTCSSATSCRPGLTGSEGVTCAIVVLQAGLRSVWSPSQAPALQSFTSPLPLSSGLVLCLTINLHLTAGRCTQHLAQALLVFQSRDHGPWLFCMSVGPNTYLNRPMALCSLPGIPSGPS